MAKKDLNEQYDTDVPVGAFKPSNYSAEGQKRWAELDAKIAERAKQTKKGGDTVD
jgi:hypothetical protein